MLFLGKLTLYILGDCFQFNAALLLGVSRVKISDQRQRPSYVGCSEYQWIIYLFIGGNMNLSLL